MSETPFQPVITIRGIGSPGGNRLYEQSVPFFIDGVFAGRAQQFAIPFFDLDRIEVVNGPQAIFFGKNATAGAVALVSARPTFDLEGRFTGSYEIENDGHVLEGAISGPLTEDIAARIAFREARQGAYLFDAAAGEETGIVDEFAIRGSLLVEPTQNFEIYAKAEYAERLQDGRFEQAYCANRNFTVFPDPADMTRTTLVECVEDKVTTTGAINGPLVGLNPPGSEFKDIELFNGALRMSWDFSGLTLQSITGYSEYNTDESVGADFSVAGVTASFVQENFRQWSQEFRILTSEDRPIEVIAGAFIMDQRHLIDNTIAQLNPPPLTGTGPGQTPSPVIGDYIDVAQDTFAISAFAGLTWNISDRARLSAGARFTYDKKEYAASTSRFVLPLAAQLNIDLAQQNRDMAFAVFNYDLERSESSLDPAVTFEYDFSDDVMAYATLARGTKAGGFEHFPRAVIIPVSADSVEYEEENATNVELGLKSELFDRALRFNAAAFYTEFDDLQIQKFNGRVLGFETLNAERTTVAGIEVDTRWQISRNFAVGGAVTYLDVEFDKFINDVVNPPVDLSGNTPFSAAEWSGLVYSSFEAPLTANGGLELSGRIQGNFRSNAPGSEENLPTDELNGFFTVDGRLALGAPDDG